MSRYFSKASNLLVWLAVIIPTDFNQNRKMIALLITLGLVGFLIYHNKARFQLGVGPFNEPIDEVLDMLILGGLRGGISSVTVTNQYLGLIVEFKNGVVLKAWNHNRYYAWLQCGSIGEYQWNGGRPAAETMVKLKDAIKDYYTN